MTDEEWNQVEEELQQTEADFWIVQNKNFGIMVINDEIAKVLKEFRIPYKDGIAYLLAKYFKVVPSYIPQNLEATMNRTGIFYMDNFNSLEWKIPLFSDVEQEPWNWVKTDYREMFKNANSDRAGNGNDCVRRMKKLFADYPDIRKEEVLNATRMYISSTNPDYIRKSHFFIEKGKGSEKTQDILEWIEKYRESTNRGHDKFTKMQ